MTIKKGPVAVGGGERGGGNETTRQSSFIPPKLQAPNTWSQTKQIGDEAEDRLADWFKAQDYHVLRTHGREDYDIQLIRFIEVKHDIAAVRTGRVAVEVSFDGKPSGLTTSRADFWVFVIADDASLVPIAALRSVVASGRYRTVPAGDGLRARCFLIRTPELKRLSGTRTIPLGPARSVAG